MPINPIPPQSQSNNPPCPPFADNGPQQIPPGDAASWFGFGVSTDPAGKTVYTIPEWWEPIWNALPGPFDGIITAFPILFLDGCGFVAEVIAGVFGCGADGFGAPAVAASVLGIFEKWFGLDVPPIRLNLDNQMNYYCPQELPARNDADSAYLGGYINYDTWRCWVRTGGMHENNAYPLMIMKRQQVPGQDIIRLYWKGELTEQQVGEQLRGQGWFDSHDQEMLAASMEYVIPPTDLIRMMVRDVFNPDVVTSYNLDAEFAASYRGIAPQLAMANGISDDYMKLYWEAHWQVPSNGQLYQMYHRLRPGAPGIDPADYFTLADLQKALAVNDNSPQWRGKLSAIASAVITRVDAQRMYFAGVIDETRLHGLYMDNGYTADDADAVLQWQILQRRQWVFKTAADYSLASVCTLYADSVISTADAIQRLQTLGYDDETISYSLSAAQQKMSDKVRKDTIAGIKRRYTRGGYDEATTMSYLLKTGIDATQAESLIIRWRNLLIHQDKFPAVATLCNWFKSGLIALPEYQTRLQWLGYTYDDATKTVQQCAIKALPKPKKPKLLSISQLCKAVKIGDLNTDDFISGAVANGYDAGTAQILLDECLAPPPPKPPKPPKPPAPPKPPPPPAHLTVSDIESAWQYGVMTWENAIQALVGINYLQNDANTILTAFAEKNGLAPGSDQPEPIKPV